MNIPYFDAHCDTVSRVTYFPGRHFAGHTGQWDLDRLFDAVPKAPKAQFFAIFHDSVLPGYRAAVEKQIKAFHSECQRYSDRVQHCRTAEEAEAAFKEGKLAAFLSVEGGELLECSLERLQWAYDQGVRAVNLTWNHPNALSGSNKKETDRGLSEQGKAFVQKMNELGMIIDVSHLSDPGFWDVMEITTKPIMASHSNSRDVFFHTRNLTDSQFTAIIKNHGIVGLNCHALFLADGKVDMTDLQRHLDHFLALGGEKTVALGGDWDGGITLPAGFEGCWSWPDFYEYLAKQNYPEQLLQDLFFNNLMRTVREVCTI